MTVLEERLRRELHGYSALALREIDEAVFGPQLPDWVVFRVVPACIFGWVTCKCGSGRNALEEPACWACGDRGEPG